MEISSSWTAIKFETSQIYEIQVLFPLPFDLIVTSIHPTLWLSEIWKLQQLTSPSVDFGLIFLHPHKAYQTWNMDFFIQSRSRSNPASPSTRFTLKIMTGHWDLGRSDS